MIPEKRLELEREKAQHEAEKEQARAARQAQKEETERAKREEELRQARAERERAEQVRQARLEQVRQASLEQSSETESRHPCPFCGEQILESAVKCHFCGEFLDGRAQRQVPKNPPRSLLSQLGRGITMGAIACVVLCGGLLFFSNPPREPSSNSSRQTTSSGPKVSLTAAAAALVVSDPDITDTFVEGDVALLTVSQNWHLRPKQFRLQKVQEIADKVKSVASNESFALRFYDVRNNFVGKVTVIRGEAINASVED